MKKTTDELTKILKSTKNYRTFLSENIGEMEFKTVGECLTLLLESKNLKKADVIRKSNLDKTYAYQIFKERKENPGRDKILMLAIAMGLTIDETNRLLKIAEVPPLYVRMPRDSVIIFSIENGRSVIETNEILSEVGQKILE